MDQLLIEYLLSQEAVVLIGSGPSIASGYPSWNSLSTSAIKLIKEEHPTDLSNLTKKHDSKDYPKVFDEAASICGMPKLLDRLKSSFIRSASGNNDIYRQIVNWPVPIFITTNYDDEIHDNLASISLAYATYRNTSDDLDNLGSDSKNMIFKLHGDLSSDKGLILTQSQYDEICNGDEWQYWRTKLTTIFQSRKVIVIGHSLTDPNIQHVLKAAKTGASVTNPICWIAPNIGFKDRDEYLNKYKIRVISYQDQDGKHSNLRKLIQSISDFVPPRVTGAIKSKYTPKPSALGSRSAAPGLFIFNTLSKHIDIEKKREESIYGAICSILPDLDRQGSFSIERILELLNWPNRNHHKQQITKKFKTIGIERELLIEEGSSFIVNKAALDKVAENERNFTHSRKLFLSSLQLRIRRDFKGLPETVVQMISEDIDNSLTDFFREGGLTFATSIFASSHTDTQRLPANIIKFINEASTKYDNYHFRLIFFKTTIDAFLRAETAEKEYLGKVSQGFFLLNTLGVYGDEAKCRLDHAISTVWLVDSNAQIPLLALGAPTHDLFQTCFTSLTEQGLRFFSTESVANENLRHLDFALKCIRNNGADSHYIIAAATGDAPYYKSNQFLEGYIALKASGIVHSWDNYLYQLFSKNNPTKDDVYNKLKSIGLEVVELDAWPGFDQIDLKQRDEDTNKIADISKEHRNITEDDDEFEGLLKKAEPEAESLRIVLNERNGKYNILSDKNVKSSSYFISDTSVINLLNKDQERVTWQLESFLRYADTLCYTGMDAESQNRSFELLLWQLAQSGICALRDELVMKAFGGLIDQSTILTEEQLQIYDTHLKEKYGENPKHILLRINPIKRPLASLQLAQEMLDVVSTEKISAEKERDDLRKHVKHVEDDLSGLEKYRAKVVQRKEKAAKNRRKQQSGASKKKKKKKKKKR